VPPVGTRVLTTRADIDQLRDAVAGSMKLSLDAAAFADHPVFLPALQMALCNGLLQTSQELANG
jgi:hypothetical protein